MFDLFSDIFARRDNLFTRMDARVKLVIAFSAILAVIFSSQVYLPVGMCIVCTSTMLAVGLPARIVLVRLASPLGIVIVLIVLKAFVTAGAPVFSFTLFGVDLAATREGLSKGALLGSRVLGSVSVVLLLGAVTPAFKVFRALRWFGVPESWVEIALLVYRYVFAVLDLTTEIADAQRVRLGYSNLRNTMNSVGVLAGTVITRSMDQAMRTYDAMVLRGYDGRILCGHLPDMRPQDRLCGVVAVAVVAILYVILEWWPT